EDGIRDDLVTGVQTCALPIYQVRVQLSVALERDRQLHAHLVLLVGGEDVDDAVDRLRRALRVQRREDEVAGLGRGQGGRDGLEEIGRASCRERVAREGVRVAS